MAVPKIVSYTVKEKLLLASLVDKHKLVENKKTDAATIQLKQKEWDNISVEYNSQGDVITVPRTAVQLKKLWNNLKQKKRKINTDEKYARLLTGGGPTIEFEKDPVMEAVDVAAPHADVTLACPWDSTATYMINNNIQEPSNEDEIIQILVENNADIEMVTKPQTELPSASHNNEHNNDNRVQKEENQKLLRNAADFTPKSKSAKLLLQSESNLRIQKLEEAIQQQATLHTIKMKVEEESLKKISSERRRAEAEEELTLLKLKVFKQDNNL